MSEQETKTLGQIAYEALIGLAGYRHWQPWEELAEHNRVAYDGMAQAVRAAVLDEQATLTPGERAYEMWRGFTWDNQKNPTLEWDQLTMRDHANWEVIADPDGSPRRAEEHGTTDRRAISPEVLRAQHLMAHIEEAIVRGLSMSQALRLDAQTALAIQAAIRDGMMAGLNSWEETRHG